MTTGTHQACIDLLEEKQQRITYLESVLNAIALGCANNSNIYGKDGWMSRTDASNKANEALGRKVADRIEG